MDANSRQERAEIEVFGQFVQAAMLRVEQGSIQKRNPPEPDILCHVEGEGPVAFELVELIDRDFARKINTAIDLKGRLEELFNQLPQNERDEISHRFGNAVVEVVPRNGASSRRVESDLPNVLRALQTAPFGLEDMVSATALGLEATEINHLLVARGELNGPCFDLDTTLTCSDPTVERIAAKFKKNYKTTAPIELLAYSELQPPAPGNTWKPSLLEYCQSNLGQSPFRRIWIFCIRSREILLTFPET